MLAKNELTQAQTFWGCQALRCTAAVLGASLLLAAASLSAAESTPEEIAKAVKELGDGRFHVREQASDFLWKAGRAAEPAVREAARSSDAEVARRAAALFDKFQWGIYPDTPQDILQLIERYRQGNQQAKSQVIAELTGKGRQGDEMLVKLFLAEQNNQTRGLFFQQGPSGVPSIVPRLLLRGDFDLAERVLEECAAGYDQGLPVIGHYAMYLLLRGRIDEKIAQLKAKGERTQSQARILAYLHWAKGDLAQARQAAEKTSDRRALAGILFEIGDWKELAQHHRPEIGVHVSNELEQLARLTAYQRLAGDKKGFEETGTKVRQQATDALPKGDAWQWLKILFMNQQFADAFELLSKSADTQTAFALLCAQFKYREAFALAVAAKAQKHQAWVTTEITRAKTLHDLGEVKQSQELLTQLGPEIIDLKSNYGHPYTYLIEVEYQVGLDEQAFTDCAAFLSKADHKDSRVGVLWKVFPEDGDTPQSWWWYFRQKQQHEDHAITMRRVREVMDGKTGREELARVVLDAEQAARGLEPLHHWIKLEALGKTCLSAGLEARAQDLLEKAAKLSNAPRPFLTLGDWLAKQGRWKEAAELYRQAGERQGRDWHLALYLRGWALVQAGQEKDGQKLIDMASLLPLADMSSRSELAWGLEKRGLTQEARRQRKLVRDWDFSLDTDAFAIMAGEAAAKRDYFKAATCYEQAQAHATGFSESRFYLLVPCWIHQYRARGFLAVGKVAEALQEADLALALLPGEIEVPIHLAPGLEKLGRHKEAGELFARVYKVHDQVCTAYPRAAAHHNWLAWLSARCGRRLDDALTHAQGAVALAPENSAYLDTLAEVHFQRGEKDKAIALMKRCLELAPQRAYFRAQLQRFEAGDPSAPLPPEENEGNRDGSP